MRRWPTWLVVGALVALGAFALADGLRRNAANPTIPTRVAGTLARPLGASGGGVAGVLYYTDEHCVLKGIRLWGLIESRAPSWRGCRFSMSPDGATLADRRAVWQRQGGLYAIERGAGIELSSPASAESLPVVGDAPAFKPDGSFTYVEDGSVVEWTQRCPPG